MLLWVFSSATKERRLIAMLGLHVGVQMVSFSIIFLNIVKRLVVDRGFNNT